MKKIYQETISEQKSQSGNVVPEHVITYQYDTKNIKDYCVECKVKIEINENRYIQRGNYCPKCNARYSYGKK